MKKIFLLIAWHWTRMVIVQAYDSEKSAKKALAMLGERTISPSMDSVITFSVTSVPLSFSENLEDPEPDDLEIVALKAHSKL